MKTFHFKTIAEAHQFYGLPAPEHPLLSVISDDASREGFRKPIEDEPYIVTQDFYRIGLKKVISGAMRYGRTKYDFTNGTMLFAAPRHQIEIDNVVINAKFYSILFHEDFLKDHDIRNRIKKYGFFTYAGNEALHLSPREERVIESIIKNIGTEYQNNADEFSREIILSQIDTLLRYANRFYKRQFIHRQEMSGAVLAQFEHAMTQYFEADQFKVQGTPRVDTIARELGLSPRYLSDSLKAETGKTAIEHIHLYLIDEAKNLLLEPGSKISETAYTLGFDSPKYFSRLFKKKVGVSPTVYQAQMS
ncbi:MAG: helix-turn-helix transcriptional regulator [Chloroflexota bacterium]